MSTIVVAGGSIGGLAVALFAASAGHDVVVVEADGAVAPRDAADAWEHWKRRGVPQFRQLHGTQALGRSVLAARAPDVLQWLREAGAHDADLLASRPDARRLPGADDLVQFRCRRPVLEWVLRAAVGVEPAITHRAATEVTGLLVAGGRRPRVTGVTTNHGELPADLVVDATGRRSRVVEWCVRAAATPPSTTMVDTGQAYFTRWFRRRAAFTGSDPMLRVDLSSATLLVFPADAGWFSATFFARAHDRALREVLMDPHGFAGALRSVPQAAAWLDGARPVGDVRFMGKLFNQLRRPRRDGSSPAGLLSVADAAICTNPTWGRGAALALAHAAALVDLVGEHDDPRVATAALARWTAGHLEPWFHDTVLLDAETNARWAGRQPEPSPARPFRHADAVAAARTDPEVLVAYLRYRNLLEAPATFWSDPGTLARTRSAVGAGTGAGAADLPSREHLLAAAHAAR
jgi:2-polyprenyl-6-methoxyphenol hydroxylase-like FAD-dependent oxidoreductase